MAINDEVTPGSDSFWLNMSAESIYNSFAKREASVKSLITIILWTFGLFAAGTGGFLSIFGGIKDFDGWALFALGIAFFFLCLAYFFANRALYPIASLFRPAEVKGFQEAFSETTKTQTERFRTASGFTAAGFFFLAFGIFLQFRSLSKPKPVCNIPTISLQASIEKRGDSVNVPVTAMSKGRQAVELYFYNSTNIDSITNNIKKLIFNRVFKTDSLGRLYYSYYVPSDTIKAIIVKATFREMSKPDSVEEKTKAIKLIIK